MDRVVKRRGLGRGLEALIPAAGHEVARRDASEEERVVQLPIASIRANPRQPRTAFPEESLEDLARSIREHGVLQPVLVCERDGIDGTYELIAGERRFRAAQRAGLATIPAIVRRVDARRSLEIALIENLQREDLNPIEEALAYRQLMQEFGLTQVEIAERVGKSRPAVANALRLLQLPPDLQAEVAAGRLSAGHARALLAAGGVEEQRRLAEQLLSGQSSVRVAERLSRSGKGGALAPDWQAAEDALRRALGLKVRLSARRDGSGKLEIEYPSVEALNQLLDRLGVTV